MSKRKVGKAEIIPIPYEDRKAWLAFRKSGLGGSEAAAVLGLDDYSNPAKVFHQKIGLLDFPDFDNESMFWGRTMEETLGNMWQYWWNGEYIDNHKAGKKVRTCRRVNGYGVNPEMPHLFGSLDRYLPKGTPTINGEILSKGGVLEIKTISEFMVSKWEHGIPEKYVIQIHVYMMIFGFEYAEIVYLAGGNKLRVIPIHFDQEIADTILYNTSKFWLDRVIPAQQLVKEYHHHLKNGRQHEAEQLLWEIDRLEPSPMGGKSYRELMNQKFGDGFVGEYHAADGPEKEMAIKHKRAKEMIKLLEKEVVDFENHLVKVHDANKIDTVRFGEDEGYSRYYMRKNGKNPTFENRIKIVVDEEAMKQQLRRLI